MSYFDQEENPFVDASLARPVTPMPLDILAIQNLYGAPASVRGGDTVYGYNSNVGGYLEQVFHTLARVSPNNILQERFQSPPALGDLNGDGHVDLVVVGRNTQQLLYFEATGPLDFDSFAQLETRTGSVNPFAAIELDTGAVTLVDIDGKVHLNVGSPTAPRWLDTGSSPIFSPEGWTALAFADLDGDGKMNIVVGDYTESLNYFLVSVGTTLQLIDLHGSDNPFAGIMVKPKTGVSLADLDGDGDSDAVAINRSGEPLFIENTGSATTPVFHAHGNPNTPALTLTVYDTDGHDRLDLRNDRNNQRIDLRPGGISDVYGLKGNWLIERNTVIEDAVAGWGDDLLIGNGVANRLEGGAGDDVLVGGAGADTLVGSAGADTFVYTVTADSPVAGPDRILDFSGTGNDGDRLDFSALGNDLRFIGDTAFSSTAGEVRYAQRGAATSSNTGDDYTDVLVDVDGNGTANVKVTLVGLHSLTRADLVGIAATTADGTPADDVLTGTTGDDTLRGLAGDDVLAGQAGADTLDGGTGADRLTGGAGTDTMTGGAGADTFVYGTSTTDSWSGSPPDRILDFSGAEGEGDRLDLSAHNGLTFIGDKAFSGVYQGEVRYVQRGADTSSKDDDVTYVLVDVDGNGGQDLWVELVGLHSLIEADFIL